MDSGAGRISLEQIGKIKSYLKNNPGSDVHAVVKGTALSYADTALGLAYLHDHGDVVQYDDKIGQQILWMLRSPEDIKMSKVTVYRSGKGIETTKTPSVDFKKLEETFHSPDVLGITVAKSD